MGRTQEGAGRHSRMTSAVGGPRCFMRLVRARTGGAGLPGMVDSTGAPLAPERFEPRYYVPVNVRATSFTHTFAAQFHRDLGRKRQPILEACVELFEHKTFPLAAFHTERRRKARRPRGVDTGERSYVGSPRDFAEIMVTPCPISI